MGIYWPLEEQRLAAGDEVLLERLPAAGKGGTWAAGRSSLSRPLEIFWKKERGRESSWREKGKLRERRS